MDYEVLRKSLGSLYLQHNGVLVKNLDYIFSVFLDVDFTCKLRLTIWNVDENWTLEDLPGIGTGDFLTLRHSLENIQETKGFLCFFAWVCLTNLENFSSEIFLSCHFLLIVHHTHVVAGNIFYRNENWET